MPAHCKRLARQLDISELAAAGNDNNAVIMVVVIVPVIMAAGFVVLRGDCAGCFLNSFFRADGTYMVRAAMQAFHASQSGEPAQYFARRGPLDAYFLAAVGAIGGGRE